MTEIFVLCLFLSVISIFFHVNSSIKFINLASFSIILKGDSSRNISSCEWEISFSEHYHEHSCFEISARHNYLSNFFPQHLLFQETAVSNAELFPEHLRLSTNFFVSPNTSSSVKSQGRQVGAGLRREVLVSLSLSQIYHFCSKRSFFQAKMNAIAYSISTNWLRKMS